MAYQTGTATGTTDLLDKLNTFAVANGWALNRRDASSLSISKNGLFQNLWEDGTEIKLFAATSFSSGSAWNAQPGGNTFTQRAREMVGSFTRYHFFANGNYIHIVVEVDPGLFKHMIFGTINKSSNYDGGQYSCSVIYDNNSRPHGLFGCYDDTVGPLYAAMNTIRINADSQPLWRQLNHNDNVADLIVVSPEYWTTVTERWPHYKDWVINSPNTATQQVIFIPVHLWVERPGGLYSPIGFFDDVRMVNITNIDPGATVNVGSDEWLIFPVWKKGVSPSNNFGYAYKKII